MFTLESNLFNLGLILKNEGYFCKAKKERFLKWLGTFIAVKAFQGMIVYCIMNEEMKLLKEVE